MNHDTQSSDFFVQRSANDRRVETYRLPPYMAEDGLVLIDRREETVRRQDGDSVNRQ